MVIGELPKLTGTKATGSNPLQELWSWLGTLGDVQGLTVVVGLVALAVVFGLRVIAPRIPEPSSWSSAVWWRPRPPMPLLGREPGTQAFRELDEHPGDEQFPGIVVLRLDGGLFFATSDALEDRVREVALSTPGITGIVRRKSGR